MLGKLWQKIKQNHLLLMALCCLIPIILFFGLSLLFKGGFGDLTWIIILLCPLLHLLMMRNHKSGNHCKDEANKDIKK